MRHITKVCVFLVHTQIAWVLGGPGSGVVCQKLFQIVLDHIIKSEQNLDPGFLYSLQLLSGCGNYVTWGHVLICTCGAGRRCCVTHKRNLSGYSVSSTIFTYRLRL